VVTVKGINARLYTSIPPSADPKGSNYGSNPDIYRAIEKELQARVNDIEEIHLALYLFNNEHLFNVLKNIARKSKVVVTSLPLAGYDKRKIGSATRIYKDALSKLNNPNFNLMIYPYMYMWYGAEYAEGGASYGFHVKAGYVLYKDGSCKLILTSCNLSPGDPYHSETAVVIDDSACSTPYGAAFKKFFEQVEQLAILWQSYSKQLVNLSSQLNMSNLPEHLQQAFDFAFIGDQGQNNWSASLAGKAFFTGPFITINNMGSTWYARGRIVDLIMSAEKRLLVAAQHIHDIAPFNGYSGETIIGAIIERKRCKPSLEVKVLKQTPSRGLADKRRAAFAECHLNYAGVEQRANKLIHDKFIVADNVVLIATSNFTATQFAWGKRDMKLTVADEYQVVNGVIKMALSLFQHPQGLVSIRHVMSRKLGAKKVEITKKDTFAEVNGFIVIEDERLADELATHFYRLWDHKLSEPIEIPR